MTIRHPIRSLNKKDKMTLETYNRLENFQQINAIFGNWSS